MVPAAAVAAEFELTYSGVFNGQSGLNPISQSAPTYFSVDTPFTINAWFDSNGVNYAPPSPPAPPPFAGFRAYAPSIANITIGSSTYSIDTITTNPNAGITVAIFDQTSFTPGRYGIGILARPVQDGAGIVGDWQSASTDFTAGALTSTVLQNYMGVGYSSGVCLSGQSGPSCQQHAITPLVLHDGFNTTLALTLGNFEQDYPTLHTPTSLASVGPLNEAALVATPEPGTWTLLVAGIASITGIRRIRIKG